MEYHLIKYNPILACRFDIVIPECLNIPEQLVTNFKVENNLLKLKIIETEEYNIRDTFMDIEQVNKEIPQTSGSANITIYYFNAEGHKIRTEIYQHISFEGVEFDFEANYDNLKPLTTTLIFKYIHRTNASAN